ncbi:MAG: peptidylprolyl isomerase [Alteromonas sp.]|nr:peptidylprolyl isomerase [Alteromonas sp.]MAY23123.1 peptidylprolyl isomerase [Flavobacteriaceae bacterium]|tara:strand:- start:165480 stop:166205 length:726 start_codon:yes stop_codon:yes gene_type:complete
MKYQLIFILLLIFSLSACGDQKKKSPEGNSEEIPKEILKDTAKEPKKPKKKTPQSKYPIITEDNMVSFLTEYGKKNPENRVLVSTNHGDIEITLYEDTPLHRANFIYLVKQQYFDGTFFHRVVPNFIIQGGNSDNIKTNKKRKKLGPNYRLPAELDNGRKHEYGTVSGAKEYRKNPDKKTAPYEFFIFLGPPSSTGHLNGNYTIFGRVTKGMDVVEKIANLPHDETDWPLQNVYIEAKVLD